MVHARTVSVVVAAVLALAACAHDEQVSAGDGASTDHPTTSTSGADPTTTAAPQDTETTTTAFGTDTSAVASTTPSTDRVAATSTTTAGRYVLRQQLVYSWASADIYSFNTEGGIVCVRAVLVDPYDALLYEGCPPVAAPDALIEVFGDEPVTGGGWFLMASVGDRRVAAVDAIPDTGQHPEAHRYMPVLPLEGSNPRFLMTLIPPPEHGDQMHAVSLDAYDRNFPQAGSYLGSVAYTLP